MSSSALYALLHPRFWLVWLGVGLTTLLCYMPWRLRDSIAALVARVTYRPQSKQINIARINIGLCYPGLSADDKEKFLRRYFTRYIQVLVQTPSIWWGSGDALWARLVTDGLENVVRERDAGHPVILLFNHSIAVDFGAVALSSRYPMHGIYKPFDNPVIEWLFRRGRFRFGAHLSVRGNELRSTLKAIKEGSMLAYLCDEDFGIDGSVFAPFFGQSKATLTMLPRLVRHSDCKVVPVYTHYDTSSGKFVLTFKPALQNYPDKDELTNATLLNSVFEQLIAICPDQYLWKLRFFRTQKEGDKSLYRDIDSRSRLGI